jgi:hypothetical protein
MIKFLKYASTTCAVLGCIGFALLLYLHGSKNPILLAKLGDDDGITLYVFLMSASFVSMVSCAILHTLYTHIKNNHDSIL